MEGHGGSSLKRAHTDDEAEVGVIVLGPLGKTGGGGNVGKASSVFASSPTEP